MSNQSYLQESVSSPSAPSKCYRGGDATHKSWSPPTSERCCSRHALCSDHARRDQPGRWDIPHGNTRPVERISSLASLKEGKEHPNTVKRPARNRGSELGRRIIF